jgi:hypothetical protein
LLSALAPSPVPTALAAPAPFCAKLIFLRAAADMLWLGFL